MRLISGKITEVHLKTLCMLGTIALLEYIIGVVPLSASFTRSNDAKAGG